MTIQQDNTLKQLALLILLLCGTLSVHAQLKYGFKTGLNFASIKGPSETDLNGYALENWKNTTGFHIGMTLSYKISDEFGVRGELLFSKRGAKYTYEGPDGAKGQAYRFFQHSTGSVLTQGSARYLINITNSYIDLPVMAYVRLGKLELSGGAYAGVLVQSLGEGSLRYSGKTALGNDVYEIPNASDKELDFNLNYTYLRDDPGAAASKSQDDAPVNVKVDGFVSETPKTLGAYYDYPQGSDPLYKTLDFGLVGGVSYYLSRALYVTARVQYGLADITQTKGDLQKSALGDNNTLIFRDDKDKNFMIQASVGFGF